MNKNKEYSYFLKKIIVKAGKETLKYQWKVEIQYTKRDKDDYVTQADLASNKIITSAIKKNFPDHGIISEEDPKYKSDSEYVWIIDSLDGTRNFKLGVPTYAVMIVLAKKGKVIMGSVYVP